MHEVENETCAIGISGAPVLVPLAAQLAALLLLLERSPRPPHLIKSLESVLVSFGGQCAAPLHGSSSSHGDRCWQGERMLLSTLVGMPAMASRSELLLEFAESLCHDDSGAPAGAYLILEIFEVVPSSRSRVLSFVFDCLSQARSTRST